MNTVVAEALMACAFVVGCIDEERPWVLTAQCEGAMCGCQVDDDCMLTGYHTPVQDVSECYCDDTSCGTSAPLPRATAEANREQWAMWCDVVMYACLPHCALHPPERVACEGGACLKYVQYQN